MTEAEQAKLVEAGKVLDARLQKGLILKDPVANPLQHLEQLATELSSKGYFGKIAVVGQSSTGISYVQFNADNGSGYSSSWPQWAFELAKDALLSGKKVFVIANGDPFGSNLIQVLIFSTDV